MLRLEPSVSCESLSKPGAYIRIKARFLCIDAWDGSGVSWLADWMGKKTNLVRVLIGSKVWKSLLPTETPCPGSTEFGVK